MAANQFTDLILKGKPFESVILDFSRQFLGLLNDTPVGSPIPDKLVAKSLLVEQITDCIDSYRMLMAMTPEQWKEQAESDFQFKMKSFQEHVQKLSKQHEKFKVVLDKASAWVPPTPEHEPLKVKLMELINEVIRRDCDSLEDIPSLLEPEAWFIKRHNAVHTEYQFLKEQLQKQQNQVADENDYLYQLRYSLGLIAGENQQLIERFAIIPANEDEAKAMIAYLMRSPWVIRWGHGGEPLKEDDYSPPLSARHSLS